jgi:hypothetical protein
MTEQGAERRTVDITRMPLRHGGWIGYSEDAVFVQQDDERLKIHQDAIVKIDRRVLQWDVAVMSVVLVALGGYVVATRNPLVGVAFAVIGAYSLYRTYRKRNVLVIHVENEAKPVTVHPEHPTQCLETLADVVGLE